MQLDIDLVAWWLALDPEILDAIPRYITALGLLAVLLFVSRWKGIGVEKKLIIGTIRGTVQIILMALILVVIFELRDMLVIFGLLTVMAIFAAHTASTNLEKIPGVFKVTLPGIMIGSLTVMAVSVSLGVVLPYGEYIIPMGGMVIGNSMGLASLVVDRMWSDAQKQRTLLETALALGASPAQATHMTIIESIRTGLLPNLNRYASLGIVSIPGFMSGMIIGGVNPVRAALFQVMVFIMIFLAVVITGFLVSKMFIRQMYNERMQLIVPPADA